MKAVFGAWVAVAVIGLSWGAVASAQTLTPTEKAATDRALARGRLIYVLDQAAWHTTDAVQDQAPKARLAEVKGFIAEPEGPAAERVIFYGLANGQPYMVLETHTARGKIAVREVKSGEDASLTPIEKRMIDARIAAVKAAAADPKIRPCAAAPFNTVVIPPAKAEDPVDVYLLTPQTTLKAFPAGGHFLFTVAPDGSIAASRGFTKSCLELAGSSDKPDQKPVALMVTHLLDPTPTEIHVFLALSAHMPLVVATGPADIWETNGLVIRKTKANP